MKRAAHTVQYGDITPITPTAKTFSFMEAVTGQIYIAVLIARLVGLHIAQATNKDSR
ncbi:MAG: ion channel [Candidatus Methylomirabilales bacterium]